MLYIQYVSYFTPLTNNRLLYKLVLKLENNNLKII
jgi:hypothetical protein